MRACSSVALALALVLGTASTARAQRFPFERTFDLQGVSTLDVSTMRGKIEVVAGAPGRIVVTGTATVRIAWNAPSNAVELARRVAEHPPIERDGNTVRLRPPSAAAEQKATTVSYTVRVPPDTDVRTDSDSGATTIRGVAGPVAVGTQSAAIDVADLGGTATITTSSGAVTVDGVKGALRVRTGSSGFSGRSLEGDVRVRTSSGAVDAALIGRGGVDVQTGSSAITVRGARGGVIATSQSGRVTVAGVPGSAWTLSTSSSAIDIAIERAASLSLDASTRSGSVKVEGSEVRGDVSKNRIAGTIGDDGPLVRATSGSGSILLTVGK
jgi:DUF4097 and DUF4098 domain-containing protein YvlB